MELQSPIGLLAGASYPFRAFQLLRKTPRLWGYVIFPILVNCVVGVSLYFALYFKVLIPGFQRIDGLLLNLPTWANFLGIVLRILLTGGSLLAMGLLLVQFGVILGAPWYGKLSEQLEELKTGQLPSAEPGIGAMFRDVGRALLFELKKLLLVITLGGSLLLAGFIPGVGTVIASIGGIILSVTIICLDFLDAPLERRRLKFRTKLSIIGRSLPASAGFGLVCLGLVSIPLLNLLTIPICVAAGTLLFCDRIWSRLL